VWQVLWLSWLCLCHAASLLFYTLAAPLRGQIFVIPFAVNALYSFGDAFSIWMNS
jgi:hypothetical protein